MRELALGGDRVKLLLTLIRSPDRAKAKPRDDFLGHQRRHSHETQAVEGEDVYEGRVFNFSDQPWADATGVKPLFQRTAQSGRQQTSKQVPHFMHLSWSMTWIWFLPPTIASAGHLLRQVMQA